MERPRLLALVSCWQRVWEQSPHPTSAVGGER
jgi:hypothetical protein